MGQDLNDMRARAEGGDTAAMLDLSDIYFIGDGVEKSADQSFEWLLRAAEAGDAGAQNTVGNCYEAGEPVEKNLKTASEWYLKSFKGGSADACLSLALFYEEGGYFGNNPEYALAFYEEGALRGSAMCQHRLGVKYLDGQGVRRDTIHAIDLLEKAGRGGLASAFELLGVVYLSGDHVPRNPELAFECFSQGLAYYDADPGVPLGDLPVLFGLCLLTGTGCAPDPANGARVLERSAEDGNVVAEEIMRRMAVLDPLIQLWFLGEKAYDLNAEDGWDISKLIPSKFTR